MEMLDADGLREGWWVVGFGQGHRALPAGSLIPPAFFLRPSSSSINKAIETNLS